MSEGRNTELLSSWREAMEGVTPGPWRHYRNKLRPNFSGVINEVQCRSRTPVVAWSGFDDSNRKEPKHALNAAWIARCSPSGISALLAALESTSRALSEKEGELSRAIAREDKCERIISGLCAERGDLQRDLAEARAKNAAIQYLKLEGVTPSESVVGVVAKYLTQRDEALAALKASEGRGERLCQELASARCPHELDEAALQLAAEAAYLTFQRDVRRTNDYLPEPRPFAETEGYLRDCYVEMCRAAFEAYGRRS